MRNLFISTALVISSLASFAFAANNSARENAVIVKFKATAQLKPQVKDDTVEADELLPRVYLLKSKGKSESSESLLGRYKNDPEVETVEFDKLGRPHSIPNDSLLSMQWHHTTIQTVGAWDVHTGLSATKVAVCDSGAEIAHPDLTNNILLPGYNAVNGTQDISPATKHGTWVSGAMAAVGNNSFGGAGVMWNAAILIGKITNDSTGNAYFSDMAKCIKWAADQGARVVNLSYQGMESTTINDAAVYLEGKGGLLVGSIGNDGVDASATYPDFAASLLVGATDKSDAKASFSNYATSLDVMAPGLDIVTTTTGGAFTYTWGTSFSSPLVSGLAGLIFSINPNLSPKTVQMIIKSTAADLGASGKDLYFGHGRINAAAAVLKAQASLNNQAPVADFTVSNLTGYAPLSVSFNSGNSTDPEGSALTYSWSFGNGSASNNANPSTVYNNVGTYTVTLTVSDEFGATASKSAIIKVEATPLPSIRVEKIVMSQTFRRNQAIATVTVTDLNGKVQSGASVKISWSGAVTGSSSGTTDSYGVVKLTSSKLSKSGNVTATITSISKSGTSYDAANNKISSATIYVGN